MQRYLTLTLTLCLLWTGIPAVPAQEGEPAVFSLKQAQEYAIKNSATTTNAALDVELARKKIWETTAIGLPQVSGSLSYQNMLDIPTTLLPDFITPAIIGVNENLFGLELIEDEPPIQYFPAQFGTEHNLSASGTLSQLVFNGQYLVGLQASRVFHKAARRNLEKAVTDVKFNIAQSYYLVAVLAENQRILRQSLGTLERLVFETQEAFTNGFVDDIQLNQVRLNLTNLRNAINAIDRQREVASILLKFQMGYDVGKTISISDSLGGLVGQLRQELLPGGQFRIENNINYKLMETREELQYLNMRREQSNYLPVISAFLTHQQNAMRSEFDFFDAEKDWYPTTIIGVSLNLPIFTSGMQHAKVQQARMELDKARNQKREAAQGLLLAAEEARINYNNALETLEAEEENRDLAGDIYQKTLVRFREGMSASFDLTQAHAQYLNTQSNYFNAVLSLLNAKNELDKVYQTE